MVCVLCRTHCSVSVQNSTAVINHKTVQHILWTMYVYFDWNMLHCVGTKRKRCSGCVGLCNNNCMPVVVLTSVQDAIAFYKNPPLSSSRKPFQTITCWISELLSLAMVSLGFVSYRLIITSLSLVVDWGWIWFAKNIFWCQLQESCWVTLGELC